MDIKLYALKEKIAQNNLYLDSLKKSSLIIKWKKFNNELLEEIEIDEKYPIFYSRELTKLLIKKDFIPRGYSMGRMYISYYHKYKKCYFRPNSDQFECDQNNILFVDDSGGTYDKRITIAIINNEKLITENLIDSLLIAIK